jgi:tetracycline 7-halogenase / FADH2 O2-dependent halogenase
MDGNPYDVAILGTGQAGSHLGAILAAGGARVLLLDRDEHPRFAVGESTIPHTSTMLRILAARYGVPEIEHCASFEGLRTHVGSSSCGIKRNFGFVYQRPGEPQQPDEVTQSVIAEFAHGPESHLFRQDVDAYALVQALRRGATVRQKRNVTGIEIEGDGVRIEDESGEVFRARYVVDAAGFRSPLARKYGLREPPSALETHSRTLFTHMVDVKPYERCTDPPGVHAVPRLWSQGTLHHIFDGGWLWVIPFDNHERSTNPLCSVGLTVDPRRFPRNGSPEDEFAEFLERFPGVARQFETARPAREWVATDRLQYSSVRSVGDRFCLMSHSAGFIDALFSRGLANTTEIINALAGRLLAALGDDDLSAGRFAHVDRLQRSLIRYNDRLVSCSFIAFSDFTLWNAWYRIWVVGAFLGWLRLTRAHQEFQESGDRSVFDRLEEVSNPGSLCPGLEGFEALFDAAAAEVEAVAQQGRPAAQAAAAILDLIRASGIVPPVLELGDETKRHTPVFDHGTLLQYFLWVRSSAPAELRRWYRA